MIEDGEALGLSSVEIRHLSLDRKEVELVVVVVGKEVVLVEVRKYFELVLVVVGKEVVLVEV